MGDMADYYIGLQEDSSCLYGIGRSRTRVEDRRPHKFNEERFGYAPEFEKDKNYYHKRYENLVLVNGTDKAYLIRFEKDIEVWVPKKICREVRINERNIIESVLIHGGVLGSILEQEGNRRNK